MATVPSSMGKACAAFGLGGADDRATVDLGDLLHNEEALAVEVDVLPPQADRLAATSQAREWSDEDMAVAGVLAAVATSFVVNASKLLQQRQLGEQLQRALESRVVIEQAKGITASTHSITIDQAYQRIRRHARTNNASLQVVAEAIVAVGLRV